ncbi:hypothetical protein [Flindersiella endophytica]
MICSTDFNGVLGAPLVDPAAAAPDPRLLRQPSDKTLTYRNTGKEPLTLRLAVNGASAGVLTLSSDSVTVPAGGRAEVTVTADPSTSGL